MTSLRDALATLGIAETSEPATELRAELDARYRVLARQHHPDKGGNVEMFQAISDAYQVVIRSLEGGKDELPSWKEFEPVEPKTTQPPYRYELTKSGRSTCVKTGEKIKANVIRVGSLVPQTGTYGRWNALSESRVPHAIWSTLPVYTTETPTTDQIDATVEALKKSVVIHGFDALPSSAQREVALHVAMTSNHAKAQKRKAAPEAEPESEVPGTAIVSAPARRFVAPVPGEDGVANCLDERIAVLTGTFEAVGAGAGGLDAGKEDLKRLLEKFGCKVTTSISGKTSFLMVGKDPGECKLKAAASRGIKRVSLSTLLNILKRGYLHPKPGDDPDKEPLIDRLSGGFGGGAGRALGTDKAAELGLKRMKLIAQ